MSDNRSTKFKVGDKVKVVKDFSSSKRKAGEIGVVESIDGSRLLYNVKFETADDYGIHYLWFGNDELELINDNEENKEMDNKKVNNNPKFNIGDKVKVLHDSDGDREAGEIGKVIDVRNGSDYPYRVEFVTYDSDGNYRKVFSEFELELIAANILTTNNQSLEEKIANLIKQEKPNVKSITVNITITEEIVEISKINYSHNF